MRKITILFSIILTSCGIGGGTHGSIKGYQFQVSKYILADAVSNVIESDTTIHLNAKRDYYNDIDNYLTFTIKDGGLENEYTVRYLGDSTSWNNSNTSEIFICYIYDDKGNGGSEGNDNWEKTPSEIKKKMVSLFETKFINRIDKVLHTQHADSY